MNLLLSQEEGSIQYCDVSEPLGELQECLLEVHEILQVSRFPPGILLFNFER